MTDCEQLRVIFAGTPEFAVSPLRALADSDHSIVAVYTQPDRPAGRGRKLGTSAVKQCAQELQLTCCQPESLRDATSIAELAAFKPDIMVVVAYGQILPQQVLDLPSLGCLNIHASLLPRWRGAAPIHRAILAGDERTGVSIMKMDEGLDTGPVLLSRSVDIDNHTSSQELHDTLASLGAACLNEAISGWCKGELDPLEQQHDQASYANKLIKSEATIDWLQPADSIDRQIRAFNPWPVAETQLNAKKLRIWRAHPVSEAARQSPNETNGQHAPGMVLQCDHAGLQVKCGQGSIVITELQLPGKKAVSARDFANGNDLSGVVLGGEPR